MELIKDLGMEYPTSTSKEKRRYGLYKCHCGNKFMTQISSVKNGNTTSCGCLVKVHGQRKHRLYTAWNHMIQRTINPEHKSYKDYGGRGITVCDEWFDINNFISDMYPTFKEGLSIDRIDNNKGYSKENCRWATKATQSRNTRQIYTHNKSGYRGVSWFKRDEKWRACINVGGKQHYLGCFKTALEAAKSYDKYIIDNNLEHTTNGLTIGD